MACLLTLEEVRDEFAGTEPLAGITFATAEEEGRSAPRVIFDEKWSHRAESAPVTDPVPAWLDVPQLAKRFQLTFQAAQQLGSTCRQPQDLQVSQPAWLHEQVLNWWLASGLGLRRLKLLLSPRQGEDEHGNPVPLAVAQTRDTVIPFSNLALLDKALEAIADRYGREAAAAAMVHFTFSHDLEHTDCRVVIPQAGQQAAGDSWVPGVEFTNSCIGLKQTTVTGALMREDSLAVLLDGAHSAGGFKRANSTPDEAYEWTAESTDDVLGALEASYANVGALAQMPMPEGGQLGTFVASLCREFGIAKAQLQMVTAALEDIPGGMSMYDMATAMARLGNMEGLNWRQGSSLMLAAGHVVHSEGGRCRKDRPCYRALPPGFEPPK